MKSTAWRAHLGADGGHFSITFTGAPWEVLWSFSKVSCTIANTLIALPRADRSPCPARSRPLLEVPVTRITVVGFGIGYSEAVLENTLQGNRYCSLNRGG